MTREIYMAAQLASASVWTIASLLPILKRTIRSPAGWTFTLFASSLAVYAIVDFFYLRASAAEEALLLVKVRSITVTLTALFLLLFSKWLVFKRKRSDLLLTVPSAAMLLVAWTSVTVSTVPTPWGFSPVRDMSFYVPWILYLYSYSLVGIGYLARGSSDLKRGFSAEYVKAVSFIVSIAGVLIAGLVGNIIFTLMGAQRAPLFSSLLVIPGVTMLIFLMPVTREGISNYVRKVIRSGSQVLQAFLVYHGGSLIASRSLDAHPAVDEDIFSAVLEAIQRFMKVSFPALGTGWLDAIDHGDLKILLERGRYCFLVLVTSGREDDLLRGEMKDVLARFEERNAKLLERWNGDPEELEGAREAVNLFFEMQKVF
jgi:hypothetical protein